MQWVTMAEMPIVSGAIMPLMGGGYMVARKQPPNAWILQRFGADGQPDGAEATLAAPTDETARIAPLTGGGYAAVWLELVQFERFGGSVYKLMAQSFSATGAPLGSPLQIAQSIPAFYWFPRPIAFPQVAALAGGGSVVVWAQGNGAGGLAVNARRLGAGGTPAGAVRQVAAVGSGFLGVTALSSGAYLVTWGTFGAPDGDARTFGPHDAPLGPAQPAGPSWSDYPVNGGEPPVIAPLAGGGAVMVWLRDTLPYVRVQQLAPDAAPAGSARTVDDSTSPAPTHKAPAVAGLPDGGYVVAWVEAGEVHARRFAASAAPAGEESRIDRVTTAVQPPIAVVPMAAGGFMISWSGLGTDGVRKTYARLFPAGGLLATP